jgi:hypothetical protein
LDKVEAVTAVKRIHKTFVAVRMVELASRAVVALSGFEVVLAVSCAVAHWISGGR